MNETVFLKKRSKNITKRQKRQKNCDMLFELNPLGI